MPSYRCCFLNLHAKIAGAEIIQADTDAEAVERAEAVFRKKGAGFSGVEVWDGGRHVHREIDRSLEKIRHWRKKAQGLRAAATAFAASSAREGLLHSAEAYEDLTKHAEARVQRRKHRKPEAE
jgi:hypothetical protein